MQQTKPVTILVELKGYLSDDVDIQVLSNYIHNTVEEFLVEPEDQPDSEYGVRDIVGVTII